jgi:hypothetical protein
VYLFGFTAHQHIINHMAPKQERWFWLTSDVTNFKAIPEVKTTLSPGAESYIDFCDSNPLSRLLRSRKEKTVAAILIPQPSATTGLKPF